MPTGHEIKEGWSVLLLDNYYCPEELKTQIATFAEYYNTQRYPESLKNLTPKDVYQGRATQILEKRERIKRKTIQTRRNNYKKTVAIGKSMS